MVITNRLIRSAKTPDEVAGILAHEIGHGIERHPEASAIRAMGLSFIFELISGGSSGGAGSLGVMLLQTGYMRRDEFSADAQAIRLLRGARISQKGLADFFARAADEQCDADGSRNKKEACRPSSSTEGALGLLITHTYQSEPLKLERRTHDYRHTPALT